MTMLRCLFLLTGLIWLFPLQPARVWAEGVGSDQGAKDKAGSLQLFLAIKKNPVILQEDVKCVVLLKNTGTSQFTLKFPGLDRSMPIVRVSSVSTDEVRQYQRQPGTSSHFSSELTLAPGAVLENSFSLRDIVPRLSPDEYNITVFWRYDNETRLAESNSVGLVVLPDSPANLQLVDAVGGQGGFRYGVWLNSKNRPPAIFHAGFSFSAGGGVQDILEVEAAGPDARPVATVAPPGSPLLGQWIAWLDQEMINFTHVDAKRQVLPPRQLPLPDGTWEIIPPLAGDSAAADSEQATGELLLCGSGKTAAEFRLQSVRLGKDRAERVAHATLPGPKPLWMKNLVLAGGKKYLAYLQSEGDNLSLHLVSWPGMKGDLPTPRRLSRWSGRLLAAQAGVGQNNMRGAILLQDGRDRSHIECIHWTLAHDILHLQEKKQSVNWSATRVITRASIGISDSGQTAAIIEAGDGNWYGAAGDGPLTKIPEKVTEDMLVYAVGFADGQGEPVILTGSESAGFRILQFDGSPLPQPPTPK